ncbi:cytochrome c-type biogenesis protein CcmH [Alphaproteobacteria bacterium]|jgi:cytochrome c-type biogenesis protein CcmH|nr:cytochrome c-type biogenesis protein CcmH [Alphaproteobacteria bacterium]MDC3270726.1 cytochrome c-type biogenesis protein CcmH [Alphaproteobacteria bacterium]
MKLQFFFKIFFVLFFSFSAYASQSIADKVKKLTLELRCMTCQNQSIYDSDSDYSRDIKIFVREKFEEGLNEKKIKKILTERYGEYILFKPYFNSKNLFLWLFPFILVILSIIILLKSSKKTKT